MYLSDSHEEEHCLNTPQTPSLAVGPVTCAHRASSHEQSLPQPIFSLIRTPAPHRDEDPEDLLRITEPLGAPCVCLLPSPQSVVCGATEAPLGADESLLTGIHMAKRPPALTHHPDWLHSFAKHQGFTCRPCLRSIANESDPILEFCLNQDTPVFHS